MLEQESCIPWDVWLHMLKGGHKVQDSVEDLTEDPMEKRLENT